MDIRLDRVGMILDQLATSVDISRARFEGLTDEEYLWEPAQPCWSLRRRGETTVGRPIGKGEWVLEMDRVDPEPVTSIACMIGTPAE